MITFKNYQDLNYTEKLYVDQCMKKKEFKTNILLEKDTLLFPHLIMYEDKKVGVINLHFSEITGVRICYPSVYLNIGLTRLNLFILAESLYLIFEVYRSEMTRFAIYDFNKKVINMMFKSKVHFDGISKKADILNENFVDIYYFSIRKKEYSILKQEFLLEYGL